MKDMRVEIIKEHDGLLEGSVIYIEKELKNHYKGIWPSMAGSFLVKVKKKYCKICQ